MGELFILAFVRQDVLDFRKTCAYNPPNKKSQEHSMIRVL